MRLTRRGRYAITALLDVALHQPVVVCLASISDRQNISVSYLEQLFNKLRKSGLVNGVRGPKGGYVLARAPGEITLAEIILAVEEKVDSTSCSGERNCNRNLPCLTHNLWEELNNCVFSFFSSMSLAEAARLSTSATRPLRRVDMRIGHV